MVVNFNGGYIYWCLNATWKSGNPAIDTQQAFNPMTESQGIKLPQQLYDLITTNNALYPNIQLDTKLEPSTITFRSYYRDPFPLLTLFTYKGVPTAWTGTNDVISGSFANRNDIDENICVQIYIPDQSSTNHLLLFLDGGKTVGYRWIVNEGGALIEEWDIKFAEIALTTQAISIAAGFHDSSFSAQGGWSMWDGQLISSSEKVVLASAMTITVGGSAPAGLDLKSAILEIDVDKAMEFVMSSLTAGIAYDKVKKPYIARLSGTLSGNNAVAQAIALLSAKTTATIKFQYATNKYLQFTLGVLKSIEGLNIPKAGEVINVTYVYEGSAGAALTFSWTGSEATDPSTHITHTDT